MAQEGETELGELILFASFRLDLGSATPMARYAPTRQRTEPEDRGPSNIPCRLFGICRSCSRNISSFR